MFIQKTAGLEIFIKPDNQMIIKSCLFSNKQIISDFSISESIEQLPDYLFHSAVYLFIHGKGIIYRNTNQINQGSTLLNEEEVFSQVYSKEHYSFTSYIRKDTLKAIIQPLLDKKIPICKIILGPSFLLEMPYKEQYYQLHSYSFNLSEKNDPKISFKLPENQDISESYFFSSLEHFLKSTNKNKITDHFTSELYLKELFIYHLYFKKAKQGVLILFFALLLINFLFYMKYSDSGNQNTATTGLDQFSVKEDSLKLLVTQQEKKLNIYVHKNKQGESLITDRILSTLPKGVILTEYQVNPEQFSRNNNSYTFENNKIKITGFSNNSYILNRWIQELENDHKIGKANFKSYLQESDNSKGRFEIELYLSVISLQQSQSNE